jgi:hypothetical protein
MESHDDLVWLAMWMSEPLFRKVWDNEEDSIYDQL